jgi:hypothetical protein
MTPDELYDVTGEQMNKIKEAIDGGIDGYPAIVQIGCRPPSGKVAWIGVHSPNELWNDYDAKRRFLFVLGQRFQLVSANPEAIVLVSEVWTSSKPEIRPREDPDRREAIIVNASMEKLSVVGGWFVHREGGNSDGKLILAERIALTPGQNRSDDLLRLFFDGIASAKGNGALES